MKSTTTATYRTMADIQAQSATNLYLIALRFVMLAALLMMAVGVKAQLADGVYTVNNATGQRGTMCFGTYNSTEYFGMSNITLNGHTEKSITVTSDENKYWYVTTKNGKTFLYNIGKEVFLQKHAAEATTCGTCNGGFTLESTSSYYRINDGDYHLSFCCYYQPSAQMRWLTNTEEAATLITFTPIANGTTTYATQIENANTQIDEAHEQNLGYAPKMSTEEETYSYRILNTRRYVDNDESRYIYPLAENGTYGRRLKMTTSSNESNTSEQYWYFLDAGDGYCYIVNRNTGCYIYHNTAAADNMEMELSATHRTEFKIQASVYTSSNGTFNTYNILPKGSEGNSLNPHGGADGYISVYGKGDGGSHWFFDNETNVTRCPNPEISLTGKNIEITAPDGYTIYYTTDGSVPTTSSTQYTAPFPHGNRAAGDVILSITTKEGRYNSTVTSKTLESSPLPIFLPSTDHTQIRLTCGREDAYIYYTANGDEPNYGSATTTEIIGSVDIPYADCIGKTIKAYSLQNGYIKSDIAELFVEEFTPIDENFDFSTLQETGFYYLTEDITLTSHTPIENFTGWFDGRYHTISRLTKPLFAKATNATIKNVVIKEAQVTGQGNVGALVGTASGNTRIYNCGVQSGTISGGTNVGSIAGLIEGNARVINCYSFANVSGDNVVGGIVGNNSEASTANKLQTLVMNCMFYGDLSGNGSKAPIYNGEIISNAGAQGINNYNYYRYESLYSQKGEFDKYNCALAAEERYLVRHEFYRNILNSQRKLCAFYTTGTVDGIDEIGKWVVDKAIAPYPIIKPWDKYTSVINKEIKNNKVLGTLTVTISGYGTVQLPITDMDAENHDYNYYKVQLPYYNDYFNDNYTNNRVVTGWKITAVTSDNNVEYTSFSTSGDNRYNFADRYCIEKDLYDKTGIVFAQGGYYNVPEGVTAITIEPYWGKAVYLSDATYDVVYDSWYNSGTPYRVAGNAPTKYKDQTVYNSLGDVWANLQDRKTVYDNAIVLVGNYHSYNESWSKGKAFTIMSVDEDKDNEPDYCLYHHYYGDGGRGDIAPARFDFLCIPAIGRAAKVTGSGMSMPNQGIYHPKGWFEVTETSLIRFTEFEYDNGNGKTAAPIILNNGIFEQFVSSFTQDASNTIYMRLGGNIYFEKFTQGTHTDMTHATKRSPLSVTGGEYKEFYLSGERADARTQPGDILCYSNGGFFHTFASANMEDVDGNVIIKMDHSIVDEFYGGGMKESDEAQITGDIDITINNSHVDFYCGGPKFGYMAQGKTVTTRAKGTIFGNFYGAGYGGSSYTIVKQLSPNGGDYTGNVYADALYSKYVFNTTTEDGILTNYHLDFFTYAGGTGSLVSRFFNHYAKLSLATTNDVISTLEDCTITGDFYGGGCQGAVEGNVTSTLTNCEVRNDVFAGGYSATVPTCIVRKSTPTSSPTYDQNTGVFNNDVLPDPEEYSWSSKVTTVSEDNKLLPASEDILNSLGTVKGNTTLTITGSTQIAGSVYGGGNMSKVVDGQTMVIVNGADVLINNSVFGGGNQAEVTGNTNVYVKDGRINGNVFGGGNLAKVEGKTTVVIGDSNNPEFKFDDMEEKDEIELGAPERDPNRHSATE